MSKKLYPETDIQNIANAIRALNGSTDTYTVSEMASAIALPENGYYLKQSASANPLTITDGQELNAQSCEVSFSPIQDLHGYQSPWIDSSEINNEPYLFRPVKNTATRIGNSLFDTLVGGTVAWNQLVELKESSGTTPINGIKATKTNGIIELSGTSTQSFASIFNNYLAVVGHKYLCMSKVVANPNNITVGIGFLNAQGVRTNVGTDIIGNCTSVSNAYIGILITNGVGGIVCDGYKFCANIIDLTAMFGSTIADYIYSLEQATAGSGVTYFRSLFPKDYYSYNAGQLVSVNALSHKMVGFNQWDEEWEVGSYNDRGEKTNDNIRIRNKYPIKVFGGVQYYFKKISWIFTYDINGNFIEKTQPSGLITLGDDIAYVNFMTNTNYGTTYNNDICINLHWDGERDGEYEAYEEHIYPLDSDLELRGIPKLDANNQLYYDGDTYESDGTVTRKYGYRAYQSGDESLTDAITDGTNTVYKLTTPTTETADTFTNPQLVDNWGTEEYTDSREVQIPVGHESYQANICEISGRTAINVYQSATSMTTADTTYTTQFTGTVYGATGDMVSGNWEGEWGYIASYNGETLPAEWMSDRDAYVSGTTPTTGAEVAYVLATPTEIVTAPKTIPLSENTNNFWTDGDSVQVKYYSKSL